MNLMCDIPHVKRGLLERSEGCNQQPAMDFFLGRKKRKPAFIDHAPFLFGLPNNQSGLLFFFFLQQGGAGLGNYS